jgi:hypothetical protein
MTSVLQKISPEQIKFPKLTIFAVFCDHTLISNGNVRMFCLNLADELL